MNFSRRNFLGTLSAFVVSTLPLAHSAHGGTPGAPAVASDNSGRIVKDAGSLLGWQSFYPYLHTEFHFSGLQRSKRGATLRLAEMTNTDPGGWKFQKDPRCFVLTFAVRPEDDPAKFAQGTYSVEHFALGRFDLFISEVAVLNDEHIYTAVINRVTEGLNT